MIVKEAILQPGYRLTIPKEIRQALDLRPGDRLSFVPLSRKAMVLQPVKTDKKK